MELNKLEKTIMIGIILRTLRSRVKIKHYVGLEKVPNLIKLINESQENATKEDKEEALISLINKLIDDLLEKDKG
ncbi:hypothetical protein P4310_30880 [Bacillus thuringiensis]|uniref:hypothetical protein n=1 Tax=Bacillus thuringiensis TaxID=1428 RepID=UPI000A3B052F|nr:hypothetical protein [Bacillus thuringiensis]MCU4984480.1 hypothetical protein [Bacillus cereus]MED3069791.1 hypothetical protein [Bacillus thuringiensis]OUB31608.1 hypothetical protein BK737_15600 [Bacillus thuringiensis serovar palmanyolensis]